MAYDAIWSFIPYGVMFCYLWAVFQIAALHVQGFATYHKLPVALVTFFYTLCAICGFVTVFVIMFALKYVLK